MERHSKPEQKIEQVMNSLEGMERATANPFLFSSIMGNIKQGNFKQIRAIVPLKTVWAIAAGVALLLTLNTVALSSAAKKTQATQNTSEQQGLNSSFNLYD